MDNFQLSLLGCDGFGIGPSLLLSTVKIGWHYDITAYHYHHRSPLTSSGLTKPLYLFNAPEGLARYALEHRLLRPALGAPCSTSPILLVSIGRTSAIFAFRNGPEHLGGLGGLILRISIQNLTLDLSLR